MGEFIAVLNGVEFRTRHNDYRLFMPSTSRTDYHRREKIPFPDVPPEVLQHTKVEDQVRILQFVGIWKFHHKTTHILSQVYHSVDNGDEAVVQGIQRTEYNLQRLSAILQTSAVLPGRCLDNINRYNRRIF